MSFIITTHHSSGPLKVQAATRAAALELAFNAVAMGSGAVTITDTTDGRLYSSTDFGAFLLKVRPSN
jgi:hypothetical protein